MGTFLPLTIHPLRIDASQERRIEDVYMQLDDAQMEKNEQERLKEELEWVSPLPHEL